MKVRQTDLVSNCCKTFRRNYKSGTGICRRSGNWYAWLQGFRAYGAGLNFQPMCPSHFSIPSNSTSKINTLLGGIAGVGLWSP